MILRKAKNLAVGDHIKNQYNPYGHSFEIVEINTIGNYVKVVLASQVKLAFEPNDMIEVTRSASRADVNHLSNVTEYKISDETVDAFRDIIDNYNDGNYGERLAAEKAAALFMQV